MINNPRIGRFYLLPKIHKRLHAVPGRPVISNCGYFTENISAYLDSHLQPLAKAVKSYIKDTNDFLKKLRNSPELPGDAILCTIDVVGLYPNIPHDGGLEALRHFLDLRENKTVSTESLLELAEVVLKQNYFDFNSQIYKQKRGTAIGTKAAPSYAILFMAFLEEAFLAEIELQPWLFWRYIDDIFMIWNHGEEALMEFLEKLNSFHPTIKFTAEWSREKINYLDVSVIRIGNRLHTDLFVKPTDTHQYLHASSCHVYHSKKSIPYSQALRLNRICSENSFFDKRCDELEGWLIKRGYNQAMVREQVLRARSFTREELLDRDHVNTANSKPKNPITFNITYHPSFQKVSRILKEKHLLLAPNEEHKKVFDRVPLVGFKRGKSLKDFLVRAKLPIINARAPEAGCRKCSGGSRRPCEVCKHINVTDSFSNKDGTKTFSINQGPLDCNSQNVVYLIECKICKLQYVGSTKNMFRKRFNPYKSVHRTYRGRFFDGTLDQFKSVDQASFHQHFCQPDHTGINDWLVTIIDQTVDEISLRKREMFWQYKLDTFAPLGLNERDVAIDLT